MIEDLKKYDVLGLYDLADVTHSPDQIYQILNKHYQPKFEFNQRIVFYSQYKPSRKLLDHIHRAAQLIDIDNSFILFCCNHDIKNIIHDVCVNSNHFPTLKVNVHSTPLNDSFTLSDTICVIPWSMMELGFNQIRPCCVSYQQVGTFSDGIQSTFYNDNMNLLRQQLLQGKKPNGCRECWSREERGVVSPRMLNNNYLLKDLLIKGLNNPTISQLDLKFSNSCNFKCRICGPENSSAIAKEESKAKNIPITSVTVPYKDQDVLNEILELLPTLTNIDMYGGEPFLIKSFVTLAQTAIDKGCAKNIRLHYNSNGSIYPSNLIPLWPNFREIDIHFSIDAIGPRFDLERGDTWSQVEENILKIKNLNLPNLKIRIMPVISIMNIFYIDEVLDWAKVHDFPVNPIHTSGPEEFSLTQLTRKAKDMLKEKFKNHPWSDMQSILKYIDSIPDSDAAKFIERTRYFDNLRNEDFSKSHPEIANALGYVYTKT